MLNHILLVDDNRESRDVLGRTLRHTGFSGPISTFATAAEVLAAIGCEANDAPSLVFIELSLPDAHGFDVIREIRGTLGNNASFIVAISASHDPSDVDGAFSVGANAYIEKQPMIEELEVLRQKVSGGVFPGGQLCFLRPIQHTIG